VRQKRFEIHLSKRTSRKFLIIRKLIQHVKAASIVKIFNFQAISISKNAEKCERNDID